MRNMNMGEKANRDEGEYKLLELHGVYEPAKDKISFSSNTLVMHYSIDCCWSETQQRRWGRATKANKIKLYIDN